MPSTLFCSSSALPRRCCPDCRNRCQTWPATAPSQAAFRKSSARPRAPEHGRRFVGAELHAAIGHLGHGRDGAALGDEDPAQAEAETPQRRAIGRGDAHFDVVNMAEQLRLRSLQQTGADDGMCDALLDRHEVTGDVRARFGVAVRARLSGVYALRPKWAGLTQRLLSEVDAMLARLA